MQASQQTIARAAREELENLRRSMVDLRLQRRCSLAELQKKTGVYTGALKKLEAGDRDPKLSTFLKIMLAHGKTLMVKPYQAMDIMSIREIGDFLKQYQAKEGLTRKQLAFQVGVSEKDIEEWEDWPEKGTLEQRYLVTTPLAPPTSEVRNKLLERFTSKELDIAADVVLAALEQLGIASICPVLPSPEVSDAVKRFFQFYNSRE